MVRYLFMSLLTLLMAPVFLLAAALPSRKREKLIWGSAPLISNKYWSEALKEAGRPSLTLMEDFYSHINRREDFDLLFEDFAPAWLPRKIQMGLGTCFALIFVLRNARVVHIPFSGFALNNVLLWKLESRLFRLAGIKIVVMPFGADFYMYSRVMDTTLRYGLLASYPGLAKAEAKISRRVEHWCRHADAVIAGFLIDGLGRWDVTLPQMFSIDTKRWQPKTVYSDADGSKGSVRILHTPNHRGYKGTEFIVAAVEQLKREGLQVELILLERVMNDEVRRVMSEVDILAEQIIFTGYALSGIEGMASGLPVLANLQPGPYTDLFRRYAFLEECPILSTTVESVTDNLRILVTNPALRETLGRAGRAYAEKYHSYRSAEYLFGSVHRKLLDGADVDLINLFHPLKSDYSSGFPPIEHPLRAGRLTEDIGGD